MDNDMLVKNNFIKRLFAVIIIILLFIGTVNFSFIYVHENYLRTDACACAVPFTWILAILTSVGVVVGMLTFYYLSKSFSKEKEDISEKLKNTLNFLDNSEKKILNDVIDNGGKNYQNKIVKNTGMDKVKVSRKINNLCNKEIIEKKDNGMTNLIELKKPYSDLFLEDNQ